MPVDEREFRMVLVALNDAVTWCEQAANLADQLLDVARTHRRVPQDELDAAAAQLSEMRRYLESNDVQVRRIRERAGLPASVAKPPAGSR
jgi:N-dimethylarginine dimethylaminohydrolase